MFQSSCFQSHILLFLNKELVLYVEKSEPLKYGGSWVKFQDGTYYWYENEIKFIFFSSIPYCTHSLQWFERIRRCECSKETKYCTRPTNCIYRKTSLFSTPQSAPSVVLFWKAPLCSIIFGCPVRCPFWKASLRSIIFAADIL